MKRLHCILVILMLAGCHPTLYTPGTPNVPLVDINSRTELKAGLSPRIVEVQINHLNKTNHLLQLQGSQRLSSKALGGRYEVGYGKLHRVNPTLIKYHVVGMGYSYLRNENPRFRFGSSRWGRSIQIPAYLQLGVIKTHKNHRWCFTFRPSVMYSPLSSLLRPRNLNGTELQNFHHIFYSVFDLSLNYNIGPFSLTMGSKMPGPVSHSLLKEFFLVDEYLYLRLNFSLFI